MPIRYDDLVILIRDCLGEAFAEEINDALHYYWAHPEWWGGDPEDYREEYMQLLRAFDRQHLNYFLPKFDVLRGGCITHNCECEPHG